MTQDVRSQREDVRCCLYDPRRTLVEEISRGEGFHINQSKEFLTPQNRRPPLAKLAQTKLQTIERWKAQRRQSREV